MRKVEAEPTKKKNTTLAMISLSLFHPTASLEKSDKERYVPELSFSVRRGKRYFFMVTFQKI